MLSPDDEFAAFETVDEGYAAEGIGPFGAPGRSASGEHTVRADLPTTLSFSKEAARFPSVCPGHGW